VSTEVLLRLKQDAIFRWRYPDGIDPKAITVTIDGKKDAAGKVEGAYLHFGRQKAGAEIALSFALPARSEKITIGNEGFQQYEFDIDWLGDTVLAIKPNPKNGRSGYTRVTKSTIPSSYGGDGTGPIYQRSGWRRNGKPTQYNVATDRACRIDWYSLASL
jgi:hypothetical protein